MKTIFLNKLYYEKDIQEIENKKMNVYFKNGKIWKNVTSGLCYAEIDEDKLLEIDPNYLINENEIKKIEILDE